MPLILTDQDWDELWEADATAAETTSYPNSFEVHHTWSSSYNHGWIQTLQLRDLWLNIECHQFTEEVVLKSEPDSWGPVSSFFITGTRKNQHLGLTDEILETPGGHYLEAIDAGIELDHFFPGESLLRVCFALQPSFFHQFEESATLPIELSPFLSGTETSAFYRQGMTTLEMQVILHQILNCPYQESLKRMYLEGKVLELATLQFAQFAATDSSFRADVRLRVDEIERLHQAREILMQQFEHPPSILELARKVGLNDFRLKQGFRAYFGTTIFGYLREYRLEKARRLLIEGQLNVQQVARSIGYAHSGRFAQAFKRRFGISPKTYQLQSEICIIPASENGEAKNSIQG